MGLPGGAGGRQGGQPAAPHLADAAEGEGEQDGRGEGHVSGEGKWREILNSVLCCFKYTLSKVAWVRF